MPGEEKKPSRVIFIGNIPYGLAESQIIDIFSSVGTVLNFRLVYDREKGTPKGFGFAEFADVDTAAAAVRNLNNHEVMGRTLRVDYSHEGGGAGGEGDRPRRDGGSSDPHNQATQFNAAYPYAPPAADGSTSNGAAAQPGSRLPPLPPGTDVPPNLTCPDAISRTLSTLPAPQLLDIVSQMKGVAASDPARAQELLERAPQLSYAIFQALLLLGVVDTSALATVVDQAQQQTQPAQPAQPTQQPMQPVQQPQPYAAQQSQAGQWAPPPPPQGLQYPGMPAHLAQHVQQPTPPPNPFGQQPYGAQQQGPPQQLMGGMPNLFGGGGMPGVGSGGGAGGQPQNQQQILEQIRNLTQPQIDMLDPATKAQILQLRQMLGVR